MKILLMEESGLLNPAIDAIERGAEIPALHHGDVEFQNLAMEMGDRGLGELHGRSDPSVKQ